MEVQPDLWDAKAYRLTGKSRTAKETNAKIDRLEEDIRRYYKEILDEQGISQQNLSRRRERHRATQAEVVGAVS